MFTVHFDHTLFVKLLILKNQSHPIFLRILNELWIVTRIKDDNTKFIVSEVGLQSCLWTRGLNQASYFFIHTWFLSPEPEDG